MIDLDKRKKEYEVKRPQSIPAPASLYAPAPAVWPTGHARSTTAWSECTARDAGWTWRSSFKEETRRCTDVPQRLPGFLPDRPPGDDPARRHPVYTRQAGRCRGNRPDHHAWKNAWSTACFIRSRAPACIRPNPHDIGFYRQQSAHHAQAFSGYIDAEEIDEYIATRRVFRCTQRLPGDGRPGSLPADRGSPVSGGAAAEAFPLHASGSSPASRRNPKNTSSATGTRGIPAHSWTGASWRATRTA